MLVDQKQVRISQHLSWNLPERREVEHHYGAGVVAQSRRRHDGLERTLQAEAHDRSRRDPVGFLFDMVGREPAICTWEDDDAVLPVGVDLDDSHPRRGPRDPDNRVRLDAVAVGRLHEHVAMYIVTHRTDERQCASESCRSHSLVGALAARTDCEVMPGDSLARRGQAFRRNGEVCIQ